MLSSAEAAAAAMAESITADAKIGSLPGSRLGDQAGGVWALRSKVSQLKPDLTAAQEAQARVSTVCDHVLTTRDPSFTETSLLIVLVT